MDRRLRVLAIAAPLSIGLLILVQGGAYVVRQGRLKRQVEDLRSQAAAQIKEGQFTRAADTLERLQVLLMNAGQYREALEASLAIEDVLRKVPGRQSPWNFVRIAEAYLGMGDRDKYFDWMERAVGERRFTKPDYFRGSQLDAVRSDPRFAKLVAASASMVGVEQPAKDFQIPLLDGSAFSLADQKGKVLLIDFWDVGCVPCRREMPNLRGIYGDFKDKGLEVLGISLDTERRLLNDYLRREVLPWKIACSFDGWNDRTASLYQVSATPSTWLIDRHGIVRYYDLRGDELRRAVETLVGES